MRLAQRRRWERGKKDGLVSGRNVAARAMSFQITCPHCGAETRFRLDQIGQRASCPKCKNVIAIEPSTTAAPPLPPHRLPDVALQLTCRGGAVGCCIAGAITVFFTFVPLTVALTAAFALLFQPQGPAGAGLKGLLLMALEFAIPCLYGAVCGAVLIWLCTFLLRKRPALFEYAWRGAAFGAVLPPGVVFLGLSLPLADAGRAGRSEGAAADAAALVAWDDAEHRRSGDGSAAGVAVRGNQGEA